VATEGEPLHIRAISGNVARDSKRVFEFLVGAKKGGVGEGEGEAAMNREALSR